MLDTLQTLLASQNHCPVGLNDQLRDAFLNWRTALSMPKQPP
jgi:hypothetical protein